MGHVVWLCILTLVSEAFNPCEETGKKKIPPPKERHVVFVLVSFVMGALAEGWWQWNRQT